MKFRSKTKLFFLIGSFLYLSAKTQPETPIQALSIGQKCPDLKFDNLVRFPKLTAHLSDFKGKLVILDFWATWCGSCIQSIPNLNSLQQKYPNQIFILPVSYEKKQVVEGFLKKNRVLRQAQLPSATEDSVLSKYFIHYLIPHDVWINAEGKVIAITGADEVNDSNIEHALEDTSFDISQKKDIIGQDIDKPLLIGALGKDYHFEVSNLKCSSILTGYIDGLASGNATQVMIENEQVKLLGNNSSVDHLFNMAFNATYRHDQRSPDRNEYSRMRSRMILEVKDSSYFIHSLPKSTHPFYVPGKKKLFCYEIIRPLSDSTKIASYALTELNNYFGELLGIEAIKEKRKVPCWVLVHIKKGKIPYSKGGENKLTIDPDEQTISVRNEQIDGLILGLSNTQLLGEPKPLINESGISEPLDFDIHADLTSPVSIGAALRKYGLDLIPTERELEMIVIRDKKYRSR